MSEGAAQPSILKDVLSWLADLLRRHDPYRHRDVGSFWYQAKITVDGKVYTSPGIEDRNEKGLSPAVFRLSIRQGDDFLGHLTSFFNVPGIFGSTPYQVRNHIGVDCADVLMAAYSILRPK